MVEPQEKKLSPLEFLKQVPGAPTATEIEAYKAQVPGGKLRLFAPDGGPTRVYLVRGLSGQEMETLSKQVEQLKATNPDLEMQLKASAMAVIWTNVSNNPDGKIDEFQLRAGTAGMPTTLFALVTKLSDFMDPVSLEELSAEL